MIASPLDSPAHAATFLAVLAPAGIALLVSVPAARRADRRAMAASVG